MKSIRTIWPFTLFLAAPTTSSILGQFKAVTTSLEEASDFHLKAADAQITKSDSTFAAANAAFEERITHAEYLFNLEREEAAAKMWEQRAVSAAAGAQAEAHAEEAHQLRHTASKFRALIGE